ncbi:MAG: DUF4339 domain-containing protein [Bacteroidia bacterium]
MRLYYFHDGKKSQGPFTVSDLKKQNICKETPVWFYGLPEWINAGQMLELEDVPDQMPLKATGMGLTIKKRFRGVIITLFNSFHF